MADENMASTPGVEESDLSISEYLNYVEQINICVERLRAQDSKTEWTPHKVELAMWALYQAKQHNSNLLDDMPLAGGRGKVSQSDEEQSPVSQENGKLEEDLESNEGAQVDEGVNSDRSESEVDENSNQSIEQQSETAEHLANGSAENSQLEQPNGNLHSLNGNGLHYEESNQSSNPSAVSSENEDKSNDSLLNHKADEDHSSDVQSTTPSSDLNKEESSVASLVTSSSCAVDSNVVEQNAESSVPESNQMEVTNSEQAPINEAQAQEPMDSQPTASVEKVEEELNNHHFNNNQITSNHNEGDISDNATSDLVTSVSVTTNDKLEQLGHCNGTIKSRINNVFGSVDTFINKKGALKEHLISSSEENSNNNLSEENSNLSGSNLSYTDLHSTDNAIDDGPALKRIRVE